MRVEAAPREHLGWFARRTGYALPTDFRAIQAVDGQGLVRGMVGFDHWMPNSVQMHLAVDTPIAIRHLVRPAFEYAFQQAGVGVVLGLIPGHNEGMLRVARGVGFEEVARLHRAWSDAADLVVMEVRKDACRWIERKAA